MKNIKACVISSLFCLYSLGLCSCSSLPDDDSGYGYGYGSSSGNSNVNYASRIPAKINTGGEKEVIVDPNVHVWGAYKKDGTLEKAGLASAGSDWCPDLGRRCHTSSGSYRVRSVGDASCVSKKFPLHRGGAPMPYCMYFTGGMALHGSPSGEVADGNISHGCVRMHVADAEWLRYNFVNVGTKVVVRHY